MLLVVRQVRVIASTGVQMLLVAKQAGAGMVLAGFSLFAGSSCCDSEPLVDRFFGRIVPAVVLHFKVQ